MTVVFETDGVQLSGNEASIPNAANSASVTFSKIYDNPVVVVYIPTNNGGQDIDARVANLTGSGCDLFTHEPDNEGHNDEYLYYAVAEEGVHETPEGHRIEAGVHQTDSSHEDGESFNGNRVSFVNDWASNPVLFGTPNTHNNEDWATIGIENVDSTGFDVAQQRGGTTSTVNDVAVEELGWIAIENVGSGTFDGNSFEVGTTTTTSTSWSSFSSQPDVFVESQTRDGTSSGWMRGYGRGGTDSHDWQFESSGTSQTSGYFAIEANCVVNGIDAAGDRSGTFEMRSPNTSYDTGGYASLDGSGNVTDSGGTISGVRETVGSVYETPGVEPTSTGEITANVATTTSVSAAKATSAGTGLTSTVATMQDAVVYTEDALAATETGLGGTQATVEAVLDGALTFTREGRGDNSVSGVSGIQPAGSNPPIQEGLVGRFHNSRDTRFSFSGGGNWTEDGFPNGAFRFYGHNDPGKSNGDIPPLSNITDGVTVATWVYLDRDPDQTSDNDWRAIVRDTSGSPRLLLEDQNSITGSVRIGGSRQFCGGGSIPIGEWSLVIYTFDATDGTGYTMVNGTIEADHSGYDTGTIDTPDENVEFSDGGVHPWPGRIGATFIYDRPLTESEGSEFYDAYQSTASVPSPQVNPSSVTTPTTDSMSAATAQQTSAGTFGGATTTTFGGGVEVASTQPITATAHTNVSGGGTTESTSSTRSASASTETTPSGTPTELHSGRGVVAEVYPERNKEDFRGEWNGVVEYHDFDHLRGVRSFGDYYSQRVRGKLIAPESGDYYFWVSADNHGHFWLDGEQILELDSWTSWNEWDKYPDAQKSAAITLEAGKEYSFEAYMHENAGGDRLQVGWRKPSDGDDALPVGMIPAEHLEPRGVEMLDGSVESGSVGGGVEKTTSTPSLGGAGTSVVGGSTPTSALGQAVLGAPDTGAGAFGEVLSSQTQTAVSRSSLLHVASVTDSSAIPSASTADTHVSGGGVVSAVGDGVTGSAVNSVTGSTILPIATGETILSSVLSTTNGVGSLTLANGSTILADSLSDTTSVGGVTSSYTTQFGGGVTGTTGLGVITPSSVGNVTASPLATSLGGTTSSMDGSTLGSLGSASVDSLGNVIAGSATALGGSVDSSTIATGSSSASTAPVTGLGDAGTVSRSITAGAATSTFQASTLIDVLGVPSTANLGTDTATATATTTGGGVQSATSQGLSTDPETAAGAVVVGDGMLALPKRASNSSSDTSSGSVVASTSTTPINSGKSFATPSVSNPSGSVTSKVADVEAKNLAGEQVEASLSGKQATAAADTSGGGVIESDATGVDSSIYSTTLSPATPSSMEGSFRVSSPVTDTLGVGEKSPTSAFTFGSSNTASGGGEVTPSTSSTRRSSELTETTATTYRVTTTTETETATVTTESIGGELGSAESTTSPSTETTTTDSPAVVAGASSAFVSGVVDTHSSSYAMVEQSSTSLSEGTVVADTVGAGNTEHAQTAQIESRASLTVVGSVAQVGSKTRTATVFAQGAGGYVSSTSTETTGNSSTASLSRSSPTPAGVTPGSGGGKTLATDGGSVVATAGTTPSSGASSSSSGGEVTAGVSPTSPSVGITTATSKDTETVAATSNFGADATTASVSISATDSMLSTPRVPFGSESRTVAEAEPSPIVSLGKYIEPTTAANVDAERTRVKTIVLPASIFSKVQGGGQPVEPSLNPVESPAFTEMWAQGFTSAVTYTLKAPATSASGGGGEVQMVNSTTYDGVGTTSATGGSVFVLLSDILEGEGPTIHTPGLIPGVRTDTEISESNRGMSVTERTTSTNFGSRFTIVIDDVTTDFNHYE